MSKTVLTKPKDIEGLDLESKDYVIILSLTDHRGVTICDLGRVSGISTYSDTGKVNVCAYAMGKKPHIATINIDPENLRKIEKQEIEEGLVHEADPKRNLIQYEMIEKHYII